MVKRRDIQIRDPFVIDDDGTLYLFGSTDKDIWRGRATGFDAWRAVGNGPTLFEEWEGPLPAFRPEADFWSETNFWAPEVYALSDAYYMFATFKPRLGRRGTAVLRATTLPGPFTPWSSGPVTPPGWECLDGTLYMDRDSPCLVFCHEWTQVGDGEICAMPLSPDLRQAAGEPSLLFRASSAPWAAPYTGRPTVAGSGNYVTDGPFLWRTAGGTLLLLWSSFDTRGRYNLGAARSESGRLDGPWRQSDAPLYAADGGHGMVFRAPDRRLYLTVHTPNKTPEERAVFVELVERGGTLCLAAVQ